MKSTEINSEKVIESIKKRPALYDKSDNMYFTTKKHKIFIWVEVCREVFNDWEQLSQHEKLELRHAVIKRWKNLRTCFARELSLQKKEHRYQMKGLPLQRKRKKYEYFDLMSFLLNPDVVNEIEAAIDTDEESSDPLEVNKTEYHDTSMEVKNEDIMEYDDEETKVEFINESDNDDDDALTRVEFINETDSEDDAQTSRMKFVNDSAEPSQKFYKKNEKINNNVIEIMKEIKKDEADGDKQFILSLIPSLKKLNNKQKFDARIGILKVLHDVMFQTK